MLLSGSAWSLTAAQAFKAAHGLEPGRQPAYAFRSDPEQAKRVRRKVHEGKGEIEVKFFFRDSDDMPSNPAILLLYDIPPGASEGVHTHNFGDVQQGSFDEFYYILAGKGEMQIAGQRVAVAPGDHIFTPNGVAHGIENTAAEGNLKVYLVAMRRD